MKHTDTIIIGGGQAGLAMSHSLGERGVDHVVLERGRVAERWRSERWDSLRLLTPRWLSRLPGWRYQGAEPDGFMSRQEVISYLEDYANSFSAPLYTSAAVSSLTRVEDHYRVLVSGGCGWSARNVVIATGYCDRPSLPSLSAPIAPAVAQVTSTGYRRPQALRSGGVLVVGASATGIQLAAEIAASGRPVTLAVGRHTRLPRRYRGRDIFAWFDAMGVLTETARDVWDIAASRGQPSLQLKGSNDNRSLDLGDLMQAGVRLTGRVIGAEGRRVTLAGDLAASMGHAQAKMHEQLERVDRFILQHELDAPTAPRPPRLPVPATPGVLDLGAEGIRTVLWATGYRREYPWLRVPVLDAHGEIVHDGGVTPAPGLYVLGLNFMRRRNSSFLDGVGADASELADHMVHRMARRRLAAA